MHGWMWIIGAVAVLWPVAVGCVVYQLIWSEGSRLANDVNRFSGGLTGIVELFRAETDREIAKLRRLLIVHDQLIAVSWENQFGCEANACTDGSWVGERRSPLRKIWGIRPNWYFEDVADMMLCQETPGFEYWWGRACDIPQELRSPSLWFEQFQRPETSNESALGTEEGESHRSG